MFLRGPKRNPTTRGWERWRDEALYLSIYPSIHHWAAGVALFHHSISLSLSLLAFWRQVISDLLNLSSCVCTAAAIIYTKCDGWRRSDREREKTQRRYFKSVWWFKGTSHKVTSFQQETLLLRGHAGDTGGCQGWWRSLKKAMALTHSMKDGGRQGGREREMKGKNKKWQKAPWER